MAIIATSEGGSQREPMPAGNYPARCISMIHIGTVPEEYQGEKKMQDKVRITWEFPTEQKVFKEENGEQPYNLSKEFTLSLNEKANLRKVLRNWRGVDFTEEEAKAFDIEKLVGAPCLINVIHVPKKDGSGSYANIDSISRLPKGFVCPDQVAESYIFTYENFDLAKFMALPEFLRKKMETSVQYKNSIQQDTAVNSEYSQLPSFEEETKEEKLPF